MIGLLDNWIIGEGVVSESQNEVETNERNRRNCYQAEENVLEALKRPNANETNSQINQNIFFQFYRAQKMNLCLSNEYCFILNLLVMEKEQTKVVYITFIVCFSDCCNTLQSHSFYQRNSVLLTLIDFMNHLHS